MDTTLLLSSGYQPLGLINWKKAIYLLTLGKCEVVEEYQDRILRSQYLVIKMPAVVRLVNYIRRIPQKIVKFSRSNVYARDKWKCQYCNQKFKIEDLTYDHVLPKSQGGQTCWENIVTCCKDCNIKKGNRTPAQANMKLITIPEKPTWIPAFIVPMSENLSIPDQWASYLYWTSELE